MYRETTQSDTSFRQADDEDKAPIPRPSLFNASTLTENRKEREIEELQKELRIKGEKLDEFEYLIVKASEEVRKKQAEITELKNLVELFRPAYEQLPELQERLCTKENDYIKNTREIQLRVEVQKEKEHSASLQEAYNQAKCKADSLERQLASLTSKSFKMEKELEEYMKLNEKISIEAQIKDKTIDNAEVVIKRLMKEKEVLLQENEDLKTKSLEATEKAKKYKSKVKTIKALQSKKNEIVKSLEGQSGEAEKLRSELEQYKLDFATAMRAKISERKEHADEIKALKEEQNKVREEVEGIISENKLLIQEKNSVLAELRASQEQYQKLQEKFANKEKELDSIQNLLEEEKYNFKAELETFTSQASRVLNIVAKSEESKQPSPFHSTLPPLRSLPSYTPLNTIGLNNIVNQSPLQETCQFENQTHRKAGLQSSNVLSGKLKSTPLKTNNKGQIVFSSSHQKVQEVDVSSYTLGNYYEEQEKSSMREIELLEKRGAEAQKKLQQQQSQQQISQATLSLEELKLELQHSMDREALLLQLIESITKESERELQSLQEKLKNQPVLPPIVEAAMMRREELNQRAEELNLKYFKACKLVQELQDFCIQLTTLVTDTSACSGFWSKVANQYSELATGESNTFAKQFSELLKESQGLTQIYAHHEMKSQEESRQTEEKLEKLVLQNNFAQSELKVLNDIIDSGFETLLPKCEAFSVRDAKVNGDGDFSQPLPNKLRGLLNRLEQILSKLQSKNDIMMSRCRTPTLGSIVDNPAENEEGLTYAVTRGNQSEDLQQVFAAEFHRRVEEFQQRERLKDKEITRRNQTIQELEREAETWQEKYNNLDGQLVYYQQKFRNFESQNDEITQLRKLLVAKDQELLEKARLIYQYKTESQSSQSSSSLDITALKHLLTEKETALLEKTKENEILKKSLHLRQYSNSMQTQAAEIENILNSNASLHIYSQHQGRSFIEIVVPGAKSFKN